MTRRKRRAHIIAFPEFYGPLPEFEFVRPDPKKMPTRENWERTPKCPKCGWHMHPEEFEEDDGTIQRAWVCWWPHPHTTTESLDPADVTD